LNSTASLPVLLVRADANAAIGSGHVMRCLALAQAWQDAGGRAVFLMAPESRPFSPRLEAEGIEVLACGSAPGSEEDALKTVELAGREAVGWIALDGYHFGERFQRIIKDSGRRLLFIDDYGHAGHYPADIVLNQNIYAHRELYRHREPYTRLLLGTGYALLRRDFYRWKRRRRKIRDTGARVLVTLGGSDPENVTLEVVRVLQGLKVEGLEAAVVIGGTNRHFGRLSGALRNSRMPVRLEKNVTGMAELICWADLAVSAGGGTCWELAFLGLPNIILVLAENQRKIAEGLDRAGVSVNLGSFGDCTGEKLGNALEELIGSKEKRKKMSLEGRRLVDGLGAGRVVKELKSDI